MGEAVRFDPWAVLEELRDTPAATAATAADRPARVDGGTAAIAAIAANRSNAANAAVAAGVGAQNQIASIPWKWRNAIDRLQTRARPESIPAARWTQAV